MIAAESMSGSTIGLAFVLAGALVLLNGFYVAYEFAIVAARKSSFAEDGPNGQGRIAARARASLADLSMQLAGAQLGITIASLALGRIGEPAMEALLESWLHIAFSPRVAEGVSFVVALIFFTSIHLVIGEMVPKNLALSNPEATVRVLVLPYRLYLLLFGPVVRLLNWAGNILCRLIGIEPRDELLSVRTPSELAAIVTHSALDGAIDSGDAELFQGVLGFAQRPVFETAVALKDYPSVRLGATGSQFEKALVVSGADRILVMADGGIEPIGYLHARDLLGIEELGVPVAAGLIRPMAVVRADRSLIDVLRTMRAVRRQLAVVRDNGSPVGVVSIEQLVEALIRPAAGVITDRPFES